jgi:hypothetical protein
LVIEMVIKEPQVEALDLTSPEDFVRLIVEFFCTKPVQRSEQEEQLIGSLLGRGRGQGLNYEQFNELLLVLRQNRVSQAFFDFVFGKPTVNLDELRTGIIRFRALAMLSYGNFTYARRTLSRLHSVAEIQKRLQDFGKSPDERMAELARRPDPILSVDPINRCHTWLNGEITGKVIEKEIRLANEMFSNGDPWSEETRALDFLEQLVELDDLNKKVQKKALQNSNVYLTWDYLDVYVATSMRNKWEFEEVYDFIQDVFGSELLRPLKLRFFDPTQCKCANSRDKGLLEGLMLKRACCTIYMAQEGDTLGKDSELAATLAQGKPVIVYVPQCEPEALAAKIAAYPLEYFKKRLLILNAEGVLDEPDCERQLAEFDPDYESSIDAFLQDLADHRREQPFTLAFGWDEEFKVTNEHFSTMCRLLALAESFNFERRAGLLKGRHPLSMQVDLNSGTANGVLVTRSSANCAKLLYGLMTNHLDLEIMPEPENAGFTILRETVSQSPFRVVTHNERLTNSFWNLFGERRS